MAWTSGGKVSSSTKGTSHCKKGKVVVFFFLRTVVNLNYHWKTEAKVIC